MVTVFHEHRCQLPSAKPEPSRIQVDDFLLAPRASRRIGEFQGSYSIRNRGENRSSAFKHLKKVRHFGSIRSAIALKKEWFKNVSAYSLIRIRDDLGRTHITDLQHSFAAQHLEALIVAINSTAARVDLAEESTTRAYRNRGAVDIARLSDCRISKAASCRMEAVGFISQDPTKNI